MDLNPTQPLRRIKSVYRNLAALIKDSPESGSSQKRTEATATVPAARFR